MGGQRLFLLVVCFFLYINAEAQTEVLQHPALIEMQSLLKKWQHKTYQDLSGEEMEQQIEVDERHQMIRLSIRRSKREMGDTSWRQVYEMPLRSIDTITMHYPDSLLIFHLKDKQIRQYQNGKLLDEKIQSVGLPARLKEVRNLAWQVMRQIRWYQKVSDKK